MPSKSYEEESTTTLRRKASDLAKQKWSTKAKVWLTTVGAGVPILAAVVTGLMWLKGELAWAEDVKQSATMQIITVYQLKTEDRMWKIKHDLKDIEARKQAGISLVTDSLDREQLLDEYTFLLTQKQKWDEAEKEATK